MHICYCMHAHAIMYVCMYACMHACMYVPRYVCKGLYVYVSPNYRLVRSGIRGSV